MSADEQLAKADDLYDEAVAELTAARAELAVLRARLAEWEQVRATVTPTTGPTPWYHLPSSPRSRPRYAFEDQDDYGVARDEGLL